VDNRQIADRLDALASQLELVEANPYTARAYRRAAETIRGAAVPVAELLAAGRARELRGIGRGIEERLRELVETGEIAELAELERELAPDLVGLGRYLGLGAKRSIDLARALGVRTADELREAAADGRLRSVPGIGPKTEAQLLDALARESEPRARQGLLLNSAWELVGGVAAALDGEPAGDVRRWRDSCEVLAVVCAAADPLPLLTRFAELPRIVALIARRIGLRIIGSEVWDPRRRSYRAIAERVRASGARAVFVLGNFDTNIGAVVRDLRALLGDRVEIIGPSGMAPPATLFEMAGPAARGVHITSPGRPPERVGPAGRRFVEAFGKTRPGGRVGPFDLYAAAATEVMLDALARSDGTRASVTRALASTRLKDSITGPLAFNRFGEPVPSPVRVLRAVRPVPKSPFVYNGNAGGVVEDVIAPPPALVATRASPAR
jgi:hypothetical protein